MSRSNRTVVIVVGVCLVTLGIANAITGWVKMDVYRDRKHAAVAAGGESARRPFSGTLSILDPSTDAQLLYESAATKYEYYRVVLRGGLVLVGAGSVLLVISAIGRRRRRQRRAGVEPA